MNRKYEFIRIELDMGDLDQLNGLGSVGFRVVAVVQEQSTWKTTGTGAPLLTNFALLERELPNA